MFLPELSRVRAGKEFQKQTGGKPFSLATVCAKTANYFRLRLSRPFLGFVLLWALFPATFSGLTFGPSYCLVQLEFSILKRKTNIPLPLEFRPPVEVPL